MFERANTQSSELIKFKLSQSIVKFVQLSERSYSNAIVAFFFGRSNESLARSMDRS